MGLASVSPYPRKSGATTCQFAGSAVIKGAKNAELETLPCTSITRTAFEGVALGRSRA